MCSVHNGVLEKFTCDKITNLALTCTERKWICEGTIGNKNLYSDETSLLEKCRVVIVCNRLIIIDTFIIQHFKMTWDAHKLWWWTKRGWWLDDDFSISIYYHKCEITSTLFVLIYALKKEGASIYLLFTKGEWNQLWRLIWWMIEQK